MQKSNEGSYHCVISNSAGKQASKSAELLSVGKDPTINVSLATVIAMNCLSLAHHMHVFVSVHVVNSPRTTSLSQESSVGKKSILMASKKHHTCFLSTCS